MYEIKEELINSIIINKSEFITILKKIENVDDVGKILTEIKKEYKDATHYCYAYVIRDIKKSNDDGEPSGTAGTPILEILNKNDVTNILCIVVRYFGGIKLGASGLIRAYSRSTKEAIELSTMLKIIPSKIYKIEFDYTNVKNIDNILKDEYVVSKAFNENVMYEINIIDDQILKKLKFLCSDIFFIKDSSISKEVWYN